MTCKYIIVDTLHINWQHTTHECVVYLPNVSFTYPMCRCPDLGSVSLLVYPAFIMARFRDTLAGPPTSWVSPCVSPCLNPSLSDNELPTSLWEGEGQVQLDFMSLCLLALKIGPTSLNRGEGPLSRLSHVVESGMGGKGKGGGGGMGKTNQNQPWCVDVSFKLQCPSKIAFDINAQ